jgi:hypothetical protein
MQGAMSVAGTSAIPYYYWCVREWRIGGEGEERKEYQQVLELAFTSIYTF